jgi:hypothetical protein
MGGRVEEMNGLHTHRLAALVHLVVIVEFVPLKAFGINHRACCLLRLMILVGRVGLLIKIYW